MSKRLARILVLLSALLGVLWGIFEWDQQQRPAEEPKNIPEQLRRGSWDISPIEQVLAWAELHDPLAFKGAQDLLAKGVKFEERADLLVAAARGALALGRHKESEEAASEALHLLSQRDYLPAFSRDPSHLRQEALLLQARARLVLGRDDADEPLLALAESGDLQLRSIARETLLHLTAARLGAGFALDLHAEPLLADERALNGKPQATTLAFLALLEAAAGRDPTLRVNAARSALGWDQTSPSQGILPTGLEELPPALRLERLNFLLKDTIAKGDRASTARLVMAVAESLLDSGDQQGALEAYGHAIALAMNGVADAVFAAAAIPYIQLGGDAIDAVSLLQDAQRAAGRSYGPASVKRGMLLLALADAAAHQGMVILEIRALQKLVLLAALFPEGPDLETAANAYIRLAALRIREGRPAEAEAAARAARAIIHGAHNFSR